MRKKKIRKTAAKIFCGMCILFRICICQAEPVIRECFALTDGELRIFAEGIRQGDSLNVLLGNRSCEIAPIEDFGIRTWILVDNSDSISSEERELIQEMICRIVDQVSSSEEIRFSVFGEEPEMINDFSKDYEAIQTTARSMQYKNRDSNVFQVLSQSVSELAAMDRIGCTSRLVLFTDGGETIVGGATAEETAELLQFAGIPLYIIGCGNDSERLTPLVQTARGSGGDFFLISKLRDGMQDALRPLADLTGYRITVPEELFDGSARMLELTISSESGEHKVHRTTVLPQRELPTATPIPPTTVPTPTPTGIPTVTTAPLDIFHMHTEVWISLAAVTGTAMIVLLAVICVIKNKSRKTIRTEQTDNAAGDGPQTGNVSEEEGVYAAPKETDKNNEDAETQLLPNRRDEVFAVLRDTSDSGRLFQRMLSGSVTFGKDPTRCDWTLEGDPSISRCHGRWTVRDQILSIEDLQSRNGTWINQCKVESLCIVNDQDLVRIGDSEFRIAIMVQTS